MYGSIFQQQNNQPANAFAQPMGFAQNNGVVFGNTPQSVRSNLTNEQLDVIRKKNQNGLTVFRSLAIPVIILIAWSLIRVSARYLIMVHFFPPKN